MIFRNWGTEKKIPKHELKKSERCIAAQEY